jgi:hypothetical protein
MMMPEDGLPSAPRTWRDVRDGLGDRLIRVVETLADALERALIFVGCVGIHTLIHLLLDWITPVKNGTVLQKFFDEVVSGAFYVAYVAVLYEFVAVFVPILRPIKEWKMPSK